MTASRSASNTASRHVAEVLAVRLERQRDVAVNLDAVEVVSREDARRTGHPAAGQHAGEQARRRERRHANRRDEVQTELEAGVGK